MPTLVSTFKDWSTTPGSNGPLGTDAPSTLDDSQRNAAAVMRYRVGTHGTIASAATCDIGTKEERSLAVTGTTTITSFGTSLGSEGYGIVYELTFSGALTLTHASSLVCLTAANITTVAGDTCAVRYSSSGWTMLWYSRKDGSSLAVGGTMVNGSAAAPALSFLNSTTTGIYRVGADNLGLSIGGTLRFDLSTTKVTSTLPVILPAGSASLPSISRNVNGTSDPGMYFSGNATIIQADGATTDLTVDAGQILIESGAASAGLLTVRSTSSAFAPDPSIAIETDGSTSTSRNAITITADMDGTPDLIWRVRMDGATFADGAYSGAGADFAEAFLTEGDIFPRQPVVLVGDRVRAATHEDNPADIIGVVSEKPTVVGDMGLLEKGGVPVGLLGKLSVAEGSPVNPAWRHLANNVYLVR